jgi:cysteinyl-tRNA synthetase
LLFLGDKKMSKSDGNFFAIEDVTQQFRPEVIRFFLLQAHFRSQIDYSEERLQEAAAAFERLTRGVRRLHEKLSAAVDPVPEGLISSQGEILSRALREHRQRFFAAMDDDFNSGGAIGALFGLIRDLNQYLTTAPAEVQDRSVLEDAYQLLADGDTILGLFPGGLDQFSVGMEGVIPEQVMALVREREEARRQKDWSRADSLREELTRLGYSLEDNPDGTRVSRNQ